MKRLAILLLSLAITLSCASCGRDYSGVQPLKHVEVPSSYPLSVPPSPVEEGATHQFSLRTGAQLLAGREENTTYSPMSAYFVLSLLAAGAQGETRQELLDVLGAASAEEAAEDANKLFYTHYQDEKNAKLLLANSIWFSDSMSVEESYTDLAAEKFYAELFSVDFADKKTERAMNEWCLRRTQDLVGYPASLTPEDTMHVVNAVYFYGTWSKPFYKNETARDTFETAQGTVTADFMRQQMDYSTYRWSGTWMSSDLDLEHGGRVIFVLPDEGVDVNTLLATPEALEEALFGGTEEEGAVNWKVPKVTLESSFDLVPTLEALGVSQAFSGTEADFSGISASPMFLSQVKQGTYFSLDERGVKAAAITGGAAPGSAPPPPGEPVYMHLTRPFLYAVVDPVDTVIFIGVCHNPAE